MEFPPSRPIGQSRALTFTLVVIAVLGVMAAAVFGVMSIVDRYNNRPDFPTSYHDGFRAGAIGLDHTINPYRTSTNQGDWTAWERGFSNGKIEAAEQEQKRKIQESQTLRK